MFMGRVNGVNLYKHGITRTYVCLDDQGNCYKPGKRGTFVPTDWDTEVRKLEACLRALGWTLTTPYAEDFIAQHSRFVAENAANCSFAQSPQLRYFSYTIMPLESDTAGH
jgi:hypothetical protein